MITPYDLTRFRKQVIPSWDDFNLYNSSICFNNWLSCDLEKHENHLTIYFTKINFALIQFAKINNISINLLIKNLILNTKKNV